MNIIVCDDNRSVCNQIKSYIDAYCEKNACPPMNVELFDSGESVLERFSNASDSASPDILFIDIEMGRINGIETVKAMKQRFEGLLAIFLTSHVNYAPETFRVGAFRLLLKPISEAEFDKDFLATIAEVQELRKQFVFSWKGREYVLDYKDICYIVAYNRHLHIRTKTKNCECIGKLSDLDDTLNMNGFVRVHQGYSVNMRYIAEIGQTEIVLNNGETVAMSKHRRKDVLKAFCSYSLKV